MIRARIFARSASASGLVTLLSLLARGSVGCASAPDPLRVATLANNTASAALEGARQRHETALALAIRSRAAVCRELPQGERTACRLAAAQAAAEAARPERERLAYLVLLEGAVADAIETADACRRQRLACEGSALEAAERDLGLLRAGLAQGGPPLGASS